MSMHRLLQKFMGVSLLLKMVILMGLLVTGMTAALGYYYNQHYADQVWEQTGQQALSVALSVSSIPAVREGFFHDEPSEVIQPIAEEIREEIGAEFIVVGNTNEIRYSHPIPERIGQQMVGSDNDRALLDGESYVSEAVGSLGPSIRGKTPVYDDDGEIIGVVSVGFLQEDVELTAVEFLSETWPIIGSVLFIGFIGSFLISFHVKRSIHGLEPEEIGRLFHEKNAILQSIHEGMIAIDKEGNIAMMNQRGKDYLGIQEVTDDNLLHKPLKELLPNTGLVDVVDSGEPEFNQELWIGDELYVVNRVPIYTGDQVSGAVATFRNRTEIRELSKELTQVRDYAEGLRAQTHEFSNKLYTISGLLQLNRVEDVVTYIDQETRTQQEWLRFLVSNVTDQIVSAVLLGKLNRAKELGVELTFDEHSALTEPLSKRQQENIVTILGNVIENAVEAALRDTSDQPKVHISFTDHGNDFLFEVEDNGPGISRGDVDEIFARGYSTKDADRHRGVGLSLVQAAVDDLAGTIFIEESELSGTSFVISLPKDGTDVNRGRNQ